MLDLVIHLLSWTHSCDIQTAVYSVIHSKTFDNGMICASEQSVTALADIYDDVKKEFIKQRMPCTEQERTGYGS